MNTHALTPSQWGAIFTLLSMDRTDPVIPYMGIPLEDRAGFRKRLRELIQDNRREYLADPTRVPDLAAKVLSSLARHDGPEAAERFHTWATTVFAETHADQPQWAGWSALFRASPLLRRAERTGVLPADTCQRLTDRLSAHPDEGRLAEAIADAKAMPMSDWDLEMYAIHGFADQDELSDPFTMVRFIAELHGFQEFWEWMRPRLSPEQKEALRALGQKIVDEREIWLPGPLSHPDELTRKV